MSALRAYETVQLETTAPQHTVAAVLDRALVHIHRAESAIGAARPAEAHDALMRAQIAVTALRTALRREAFPELVDLLQPLYTHVLAVLADANVRKDATSLASVRQVLEPLRQAFAEAAVKEASHR
jgi:flagellar protein FliS